jgi:MFS family permease
LKKKYEKTNPNQLVNDDESNFDDMADTSMNTTSTTNRTSRGGGGGGGGGGPIPFMNIGSERKQNYWRLFAFCKTRKCMAFLFVIWFMGIGVGIVFTFLFWHLQDLGGTPALYGFASVINHMSELIAYFFVHQLVAKFGHVKLFYAGLFGNFVRFVYVSLLTEPYWILPFEFIQGVTHALVWATATSFFAQSVPEDLRPTAQGMLQAIHFGLGRGCGAIIGGLLITWFGCKVTFCLYGLLCLFAMAGYIAINHFMHDTSPEATTTAVAEQVEYDEDGNVKSVAAATAPAAGLKMMADTNYYYQPSANQDPNSSQLNPISK